MTKHKTSEFTFDDGVFLPFEEAKPKHVQFFCMTDNDLAESCNLRLFYMMPLISDAESN